MTIDQNMYWVVLSVVANPASFCRTCIFYTFCRCQSPDNNGDLRREQYPQVPISILLKLLKKTNKDNSVIETDTAIEFIYGIQRRANKYLNECKFPSFTSYFP